jgi:hypothetical protein
LALIVSVLLLGSCAAAAMLTLQLMDPDLLAAWLGGGTEKTARLPLPQDAASGPDAIKTASGSAISWIRIH